MKVDTAYRTSYNDKDPDSFDPILQEYHRLLWNKPLPGGGTFSLTGSCDLPYRLYHRSKLGNFSLSSDGIVHTYRYWRRMSHIIEEIPPDEMDAFFGLACTIGSYIVFPSNKIGGASTINMERGTNRSINDRFDLTLECIRRRYEDEESPLSDCLNRYADFFRLFTDFRGYAEFFLLNDLIGTANNITFWLPFEEFGVTPSLPNSKDQYLEYMKNASDFTKARNVRIEKWVRNNL